jgi:hypothetical protein
MTTLRNATDSLTVTDQSPFPSTTLGEDVTFEYFVKSQSDYDRLKQYQRYAGYAEVTQTVGGVMVHNPADLSSEPINELLLAVEPDPSDARGVWGVIQEIRDDTQRPGEIARVSITLTIIGRVSNYPNQSDIESARTAF